MNECFLIGLREGNTYTLDLNNLNACKLKCLIATDFNVNLWHRRLGHVGIIIIEKLVKNNIIIGIPSLTFDDFDVCESCIRGKHFRESFRSKNQISTSRVLELLHLDLFSHSRVKSLDSKSYAFVIVDDYSRCTWVLFLTHKFDTI